MKKKRDILEEMVAQEDADRAKAKEEREALATIKANILEEMISQANAMVMQEGGILHSRQLRASLSAVAEQLAKLYLVIERQRRLRDHRQNLILSKSSLPIQRRNT